MSSVAYLVFSQSVDTVLPIDRLTTQARAHFDAVVSAARPGSSGASCLSYVSRGAHGEFEVSIRQLSADDVAAAQVVERSRPTGGLADLASRCKTVWTVDALEAPEWLVFEFSALLASIALGPILTPDGSSLLGVRGARERANRLRGGPALMR